MAIEQGGAAGEGFATISSDGRVLDSWFLQLRLSAKADGAATAQLTEREIKGSLGEPAAGYARHDDIRNVDIVPIHGFVEDGLLDYVTARTGAVTEGRLAKTHGVVSTLNALASYAVAAAATGSPHVGLLSYFLAVALGYSGRDQWDPAFYLFGGFLLFGALCWLLVDAERPAIPDSPG